MQRRCLVTLDATCVSCETGFAPCCSSCDRLQALDSVRSACVAFLSRVRHPVHDRRRTRRAERRLCMARPHLRVGRNLAIPAAHRDLLIKSCSQFQLPESIA
eukprot:6174992-Pleurochrysis_carterae.AAC.3